MTDWRIALPPRVDAALQRARPRLGATLVRGPWGGWTWLAGPALFLAAPDTLAVAIGLVGVLGVHAATWFHWRATAARDPRGPVLLGLERTRTRFNALEPQIRVREMELSAGLRTTDPVMDHALATRRGLDGFAHAVGRALSQQPPIGQRRTGWTGSRGGLENHGEDLKRLSQRVAQLEKSLEGVILTETLAERSVLPFPRRP